MERQKLGKRRRSIHILLDFALIFGLKPFHLLHALGYSDQIGRFLSTCKVAQIFANFLQYFENHLLLSKNYCSFLTKI